MAISGLGLEQGYTGCVMYVGSGSDDNDGCRLKICGVFGWYSGCEERLRVSVAVDLLGHVDNNGNIVALGINLTPWLELRPQGTFSVGLCTSGAAEYLLLAVGPGLATSISLRISASYVLPVLYFGSLISDSKAQSSTRSYTTFVHIEVVSPSSSLADADNRRSNFCPLRHRFTNGVILLYFPSNSIDLNA